ncbi:hypothetical protein R80B4_01901 [Fibrobacteres bacterium R8-0-B4]
MERQPSVRRILQALYYLQSRSDNKDRFNKVYLLKMLYFADRYHIRHFGGLATGDTYFAMRYGPVASLTLDVLNKSPYSINSAETIFLSDVYRLSENDVEIRSQEKDELWEGFKKALDFALKEFGQYNWNQLSALSHCYPEWKKHEIELSNPRSSVLMDMRDFFDDPDDETCFSKFGKECDPFKDDRDFLELLRDDPID